MEAKPTIKAADLLTGLIKPDLFDIIDRMLKIAFEEGKIAAKQAALDELTAKMEANHA